MGVFGDKVKKSQSPSPRIPPPQDLLIGRYWRSYPYNFLWDRQYWVYGFIYIQDMIESGITNIISNGTFQMPGFYSQVVALDGGDCCYLFI